MEYIDLFIKEVLRMYPIAIQYLFNILIWLFYNLNRISTKK